MNTDLARIAALSPEELFAELGTRSRGLSDEEAYEHARRDGLNTIADKKRMSVVLEFLSHFKDPLVVILLIAALISASLGEVVNLVIIFVMVLASVTLDFIEEHSANNAAEKLKEKVHVTATVIRNGREREVVSSAVCVGDIIFLSSGDLVPADAYIIEADDFFVDQSALTGESFPHEKRPRSETHRGEAGSEQENIIFFGSNVVSGTARAVVFRIGKNTMFGNIAERVAGEEQKSGFEQGIAAFGFFIMKIIIVLVLLIFLGNALLHRDFFESFIFALAIAVGMTPELLPVIMSVAMARGAKRMSKVGVIVRKLSAIPNFGSMDILCTDKTGTLTEDRITLVLYTDMYGEENNDVLRYTYMNSLYQTGVRNPLDKAVLTYRKIDIGSFQKTEEIPFDFTRKMMSVAVRGPEGLVLITKGAPEAILECATSCIEKGSECPLTPARRKKALAYYEKLSGEGYRVLAVAIKTDLPKREKYTIHDEDKLTLLGFVSFLDPAKRDVREVLEMLTTYGVGMKIITGDNEFVTEKICRDIGMEVTGVLLGSEIATMTDDALATRAETTNIFARFSPDEKNRVITALRSRGHVVGYLGDGINDAPSLKAADIGISVENAVDIAKETADIILTKKHLRPLIDGIVEGRKAFGNTMKYIMMSLSSNFGNMFSVLGALVYLPFLPMLPIQILLNNFIYDMSQTTISSDRVDDEWVKKPRKWNLGSVKKFMYIFGPVSSLFDFFTFVILFSVFGLSASAFQTGWFMESLATQTLVIHIIRTRMMPVRQSRASVLLTVSTVGAVLVAWSIPYTPLGEVFKFTPLPTHIVVAIAGLVLLYLGIVEVTKRFYHKRYGF